ncbi:MAG: hypothetical protein ABIJ21_05420 [Nanoarchaeota archaeon]
MKYRFAFLLAVFALIVVIGFGCAKESPVTPTSGYDLTNDTTALNPTWGTINVIYPGDGNHPDIITTVCAEDDSTNNTQQTTWGKIKYDFSQSPDDDGCPPPPEW